MPQMSPSFISMSERASGGVDTTVKSSLSGLCCLTLIDTKARVNAMFGWRVLFSSDAQ